MEAVLDDDATPEMLGEHRRDPARPGAQEHLLGQSLLDVNERVISRFVSARARPRLTSFS